MTSYRSYSDAGTYKGRSGNSIGGSFARSTTGSTLPNYRSAYSGTNSSRVPTRDKTTSGYSSLDKRDKLDDKPSYKYSCGKDLEKSRLNCGRTSAEDLSGKSSLSDGRSSLLDRYSYSNKSSSERPSSVLEKYTSRAASREKSRENDLTSRYVTSTYPGPSLRGNYGSDGKSEKKERIDHPPVSYRGLRSNSGRSSREPSPEVSSTKGPFRMFSRTPAYGRSSAVSGASDSGAVSSITSRLLNQASRLTSSRGPTSSLERSRGSAVKVAVPSTRKADEESSQKTEFTEKAAKLPVSKKPEVPAASSVKKGTRGEEDSGVRDLGVSEKGETAKNESITLTMISRCTSPTPPSSLGFVTRRRADVARLFQRQVTRSLERPETRDTEMQSDRMDDTARYSRFGSSATRVTSPWSSYLDKLSSSGTSTRNYNSPTTSGRIGGSFGYARGTDASGSRGDIASRRPSPSPPRTDQNRETRSSLTPEGPTRSRAQSGAEKETASNDESSSSYRTISRGESTSGCPRQSSTEIETRGATKSPSRNDNSGQKRSGSISKFAKALPKNDSRVSRSSSKNEINGSGDGSLATCASSISSTDSPALKIEVRSRVDGQPDNQAEKNQARDVCRSSRENSANSSNSCASLRRDSSSRTDPSSSSPSKSISRVGTSKCASRRGTSSSSTTTQQTSDVVDSVSVPTGRGKSSSGSLTSQPIKIKAPSCSSLGESACKNASSSSSSLGNSSKPSNTISNSSKSNCGETRGKPPVPKCDVSGAMKIPNTTGKYVNKDFRKSALNMETSGESSPSRTKQIDRKRTSKETKCRRSASVSSQESEVTSESIQRLFVSAASSSSSTFSPRTAEKSAKKSFGESRSPSRSARGSKSPSGSPPVLRKRSVSTGTSCSTSSSSSENEDTRERSSKDNRSIGGCTSSSSSAGSASKKRRKRQNVSSPRMERKMSVGSSRTSVLLSSADESSLTIDKPPRPPSSPRSKKHSDRSASKTEDAKSFLIRALAPVAAIFQRGKQQDSDSDDSIGNNLETLDDPNGKTPNRSADLSKSASPCLSKSRSFASAERTNSGERSRNNAGQPIKRESSDERPWWLDPNSDNVPDGVERADAYCQDEISQETTISTVLPDDGKFKPRVCRQDSGERGWWLEANDDNVKDGTRTITTSCSSSPNKSRKSASRCGSSRSSELRSRIKHQQSGERAWWLSEDPSDVPEGVEVYPAETISVKSSGNETSGSHATSGTRTLSGVRHVESGERAWWMDSMSNVPEGIVKIAPDIESSSNSDSSESFEKHEILSDHQRSLCQKKFETSGFPSDFAGAANSSGQRQSMRDEEPLGERASPEGVENPPDPPENRYEVTGRKSPYDNVPRKETGRSPFRKRPSTLPMYIGNHADIDDLLGEVSSSDRSPVLSRIRKHRAIGDYSEDSSECEEIDAAQVIIHDSTPKTPIIQRRSRDTERPQPDGYIPVSFHSRISRPRTCQFPIIREL